LNSIVVPRDQTAKVFEDLNPLEYFIMDRKLLAQGKRQAYVPLVPPLRSSSSTTLFGVDVRGVRGVALHPAQLATRKEPLVWHLHDVLRIDVMEVSPHHPPTVQLPLHLG
jgi:hypothetical protein